MNTKKVIVKNVMYILRNCNQSLKTHKKESSENLV